MRRLSLLLWALLLIGASPARAANVGRRLLVVAAPPASAGVGGVEVTAYDDSLLPDLARPAALGVVVGEGTATVRASTPVSPGQGVVTVLAFDQSRSFSRAWGTAFSLANTFADALPASGEQVHVVAFGQQLDDRGLATSATDLKAKLAALEASGAKQPYTRLRSFIQDAVQIAHNDLPLSSRGLRQVIVFTDAGEESKAYAVSDVIDAARELGVTVHVVAFPGSGKQDAWAQRFDDVKRIAEETGGRSLLVTDPAEAGLALSGLAQAGTHSFWLDLSFCGVSTAKGANFQDTISVEINPGPARTEATPAVPFRQSAAGPALQPCSPPPPAAPSEPAAATPTPVAAAAPVAPTWPWLALLGGLGLLGLLGLLGVLALASRRREEASPPAKAPPPTPIPTPAPTLPPAPADGVPADWKDPLAALPEIHLAVVEGPPDLARYYRIHRSPFTMGADPACDLLLKVASVSGRHANLQIYPSGAVFLVDLWASNGTFLDGRRLNPGERTLLKPGQVIGLSRQVSLRLELPRMGQTGPPPVEAPGPPEAPPVEAPPAVTPRPKASTIFAPVKPPEKKGG